MPNRRPLTKNSRVRRTKDDERHDAWRLTGRPSARVSLNSVLLNWAALVALWALPYLTLIDHLRLEAAHSETLQWSLLIIGTLGLVSVLYTAWRETLDPAWREKYGLTLRKRPDRPHTENIA